MNPRYLLDTNICIYLRQNKNAELQARFEQVKPGEAAVSIITQGELVYGAERSQHRERALEILEELFEMIPVLTLPEAAGAAYGDIRSNLEKRGMTIGNNDLWIAAHARAEGYVLVTNNEKEFRRIEGLKIENWAVKK